MQMSNDELSALKDYLKGRIDYARYYAEEDGWHTADIRSIDILPDGRLAVYIMFGKDAPNHISRIEFFNVDGGVFAEGTEAINKESFPEGILYRYTIKIIQNGK
ncbi:MAG: hypothetical protein NC223_03225 [Butyrivibrio sp.]|nr:hypothetical protein [Butyrivibrio sp.]